MGQLRLQQADGVAPGAESARPILYASFPRYLGDFVLWNKIANLAQKVKPTTCWFDAFFVFHPCRVAGSKRQANTFFIFCGMAVKSSQPEHDHYKPRSTRNTRNQARWEIPTDQASDNPTLHFREFGVFRG